MAGRIKFGIVTIVLAGLILAASGVTNAAPLFGVMLDSFEGYSDANGVTLQWVTASESGNVGFDLFRGLSPDVEPSRMNAEMIPSQAPGSGQGSDYAWTDAAVLSGTTYYYYLESINTQGLRERFGPVAVTVNAPTAVTVGELQVEHGTFTGQWMLLGFMSAGLVVAGYSLLRRRF